MKKLIYYLLHGILYLAPLVITVYLLYVIFRFVDGNLQVWLEKIIDIHIPGLGLVILVFLLVIIKRGCHLINGLSEHPLLAR